MCVGCDLIVTKKQYDETLEIQYKTTTETTPVQHIDFPYFHQEHHTVGGSGELMSCLCKAMGRIFKTGNVTQNAQQK